MIKIKDEDPVCCRYNTSKNKCWRHFLNDVKFEVEDLEDMLYVGASEDESTSTFYVWLHLSYLAPSEITNLKLSWNSPEPDVVEA
ncbi:hypothetical protein A2U01_0036759 [Trifolium medium]|uniref:Uncharacterized protein n=1 Tax=Trifolium medium TaxID=97028 RepID=A0A392PU54_9FABA|nr:hypothetical protein [Trifolium medium]